MTLKHLAETQKQKLLVEKHKLERQVDNAPAGILVFSRNTVKGKTYYKWYVSYPAGGHKRTRQYIKRSNRALARELARKKLKAQRLHDVENELRALDAYLNLHRERSDLETLLSSPVLRTILSEEETTQLYPLNEELEQWAHADYETNPLFPENKVIPTVDGIMVRSKSEAFIVMLLSSLHIPYRYECRLELDGHILYPDFTIRHPVTGEYYYWEHAGMLDNPSYAAGFLGKLRLYITNGILPDHQLILTYESNTQPFDISIAQDKLREFFSVEPGPLY